jgi:hypothetical protein
MSDIELDSSDGESNNKVDKKSQKRKSYSIKMKLEVIDLKITVSDLFFTGLLVFSFWTIFFWACTPFKSRYPMLKN